MEYLLTPAQRQFLSEFRTYLDGLDKGVVLDATTENMDDPMQIRGAGVRFLQLLSRDGWLGVSWPEEYGGRGLGAVEHWLFAEELYNRRLPNGLTTLNVIGPTLIRMGSEAQKAEYLPRILRAEIQIAIGYSEPNAGSDLASLRTRAVGNGKGYIVNGQKIWTTGAQVASHLWLATRTGTQESRHRGLTLLITPMDAPGISVTPIITQGGERTNMIFLDDVYIPGSQRVGAENDGWGVIVAALNFERMFYHNEPRWELRQLIDWARTEGLFEGGSTHAETVRSAIGELAVDVEVCRLFAFRGAKMLDEGKIPYAEASVNKIWWGELRQRICNLGLDLIGESGTVRYGSEGAPGAGHLERGLRSSTVWRFGGGTNEIQLDIIATRALGMPK